MHGATAVYIFSSISLSLRNADGTVFAFNFFARPWANDTPLLTDTSHRWLEEKTSAAVPPRAQTSSLNVGRLRRIERAEHGPCVIDEVGDLDGRSDAGDSKATGRRIDRRRAGELPREVRLRDRVRRRPRGRPSARCG